MASNQQSRPGQVWLSKDCVLCVFIDLLTIIPIICVFKMSFHMFHIYMCYTVSFSACEDEHPTIIPSIIYVFGWHEANCTLSDR